jgi:hypothetical protein
MLLVILVLLAVIAALVLVLVLTTRMVRVVNSTSQPVPITGSASITGAVTVGNTPSNPVAVRETDRPADQPFSLRLLLGFNAGEDQDQSTTAFTVPAKKRLVLEDVSIGAVLGTGQKVHVELIRIALDGQHLRHHVPVVFQLAQGVAGTDIYAGGRPIRIYFEPGEKLTATARRDSTFQGAFLDVFVYGYFVDLP